MGKKTQTSVVVEEELKVGDQVMFKGLGPLTVTLVNEDRIEAMTSTLRVTVHHFDKDRFDRV